MRRTLTIVLSSAVDRRRLRARVAARRGAGEEERQPDSPWRHDVLLRSGKPKNCNLSNVYKRGEPVGWRIEAVEPETGQHVEPEPSSSCI
jgi:hypothetical protein